MNAAKVMTEDIIQKFNQFINMIDKKIIEFIDLNDSKLTERISSIDWVVYFLFCKIILRPCTQYIFGKKEDTEPWRYLN